MDWSLPLRAACERNAAREAIRFHDRTLTFGQLEQRISELAGGLSRREPTTIASILANSPVAVELPMALARAGHVSVPINGRLNADETEYMLRDSCARTLVVDGEKLPLALELRERLGALEIVVTDMAATEPSADVLGLEELRGSASDLVDRDVPDEQIASIIYTSGTTGFPKGVLRSHRANAWNVASSALGSPRSVLDRELFNLPAFGIGLLHFAIPALLGGAALLLDGVFEPDRAWRILREQEVTRTFLAPTMIDSMLGSEADDGGELPSLQIIYTAYEFSERLRERAVARFGDKFLYMYGMTEAQLTCAQLGDFTRKPTSVGKTMGAMQMRIVDEEGKPLPRGQTGEITLAGPSVMSGYHGLPEETAAALRGGWVFSGDLGYIDEEGDLHFAGRKKDIIKTGGFSVDPLEVENAILTLDSVAEAAVVGVPDDHWGEMVVAFVVAAKGAQPSNERIRATCGARLASFKVPKRVQLVEALPKNATGKVERGRLRDWNPSDG